MDGLQPWMQRVGWGPEFPLLHITAWTVFAVTGLTLVTMVYVLTFSARARRTQRRRLQFNRAWRPRMALASIEDDAPRTRAPLRKRERLWWLMLWNRMQRQLRGQSHVRLNSLLRISAMEKHAGRLLRGLSVRHRLVALETLRHLGDEKWWPMVEPLCHSRNRYVGLAAAHALLAMSPGRGLAHVLALGLAREDWSERHLADLCQSAGVEACTPVLLEALAASTPETAATLSSLVTFAEPRAMQPWARNVLASAQLRSQQLGALNVLGELADPRDRAQIVGYLHCGDATLRLAALRALRRQARKNDDAHFLVALLDRTFAIRFEAAEALVSSPYLQPEDGDAWLAQIEDAYGRDQLRRAFAARPASTGTGAATT